MNQILKTLTIKVFHINNLEFSNQFGLEKNKLSLQSSLDCSSYKDLQEANVSLLEPYNRNKQVNTILDFIPISTKVYGNLGEGLTHTLSGVYILLTASEQSGKQYFNFGSSHGILNDAIKANELGTINDEDYIIHIDVTTIDESPNPRETVYNIHALADEYIQKIRNVMKRVDGRIADEEHVFQEKCNKSKKRVVMIKQIGGQGAMHDNLVLPNEPSGVDGADSIIDLKNMPVVISPNEYRDGAIRAMT